MIPFRLRFRFQVSLAQFTRVSTIAAALLLTIFSSALQASPIRTHGGIHTPQRIENLRKNIERLDWAKVERDKVTSAAAPWLALPDETLWKMVLNQNVPRCIDVTWDYKYKDEKHLGCLKCGDAIKQHGNYPYNPDFQNKPWKLTCPSCGVVFPTNDFGKYYESGLDQHGLFQHALADKSLLFNTDHPDPTDPLHKYGVDDGFGFIDQNGRTHKFIGYYTWKYWRHLQSGISALANAYLYTGDRAYARKAGILIDRLADVYPDMDWNTYAVMGWYHSDGSTKKGKIEGSIWEAWQMTQVVISYDMILSGVVDNPELYAFLKQQGETFQLPNKGSHEGFLKHVDDNVVRTVVQAVHDERIKGNFGMRQRAMIAASLTLNQEPETEELIEWCFAGNGGRLTADIISEIDRDGFGNEAAPGYALSVWLGALNTAADLLANSPAYTKRDMYRDYPNFLRMFTAGVRLLVLDWTVPNIGDTGATGLIHKIQASPDIIARAYKYGGDKEAAILAYRANRNSGNGILRDIFAEEPDAIANEIERIGSAAPDDVTTPGFHLTGFGLASLETGRGPTGRALWLYYGRNGGHGHRDQLNIGMFGFGFDLLPDIGYPEFASSQPEGRCWVQNTISHNLVVVDRQRQKTNWTGFPRWFMRMPGLQGVEVECPHAYPQTTNYARTLLLVDAPDNNAYGIDIFRVAGGSDHLLSFHGPPGDVTAVNLKLDRQTTGTYAGEEVVRDTDRPDGFSFLWNVQRDMNPPAAFELDWKVQDGYRGAKVSDDTHVRWHVRTQVDDVALADGRVPQNKAGNPKSLPYALLRRQGDNLESSFASVIEPYQKLPFIRSVTALPEHGGAVTALQIEHSGLIDYIIRNDTTSTIELSSGISLDGTIGVVRVSGGKPISMHLVNGRRLAFGSQVLKQEAAAYTGTVTRMDKDMAGDGELWVDVALPPGKALAGEQIIIENDRKRSACFEIVSVVEEGAGSRISCGPVSFVRALKDVNDPDKGFTYDFEEGARFTIPRHANWTR